MSYHDVINGLRPFNDVEWIGSDMIGEIAVFVTAGVGPIPKTAYLNEAEFELVTNWVFSLKLDLRLNLERGIYVYDYSGLSGNYGWYDPAYTYKKICQNTSSEIIEVPKDILNISKRNIFKGIKFADCESVLIESIFRDINV